MASRKDIHTMISQILISEADALTINASPLIRCRLIHLITYIYDYIFSAKELENYKIAYTEFMVKCLQPDPNVPETEAVSLQACECFKAILTNIDYKKNPLFEPIIGNIIDTLIEISLQI